MKGIVIAIILAAGIWSLICAAINFASGGDPFMTFVFSGGFGLAIGLTLRLARSGG